VPAEVSERGWRHRGSLLVHLGLALLAYVPILRTAPGIVGADTKTYLYLDPAKLLSRAVTMWDPNVGMGTLTHQTIGYLFPMGPWYWLFETLGAPDWVAQRLWLATVLFAAGAGILFLARTLRWHGAGPVVAALVYMLSPYVLDYSVRISVILLPWAALPWMVGLVDRALRRGGWRHPALFALVVLCVGGVNATALLFAGLGPVLWIPFAVWGTRDVAFGRALATIGRIGLLTALTSLWWVMGLAVQGAYGIPILRYTETIETVARTSLTSELLRGLGYWFFYGNDKLGPWIEPSVDYTQQTWLIVVGFAVPVLALVAAAVVRWRHRAYCICLIVVGTVIGVGANPYDDPSPLGAAFKALAGTSTVGLALRSTPRAVPLIALGTALLLGTGITALARRLPRAELPVAVLAALLVLAGLPALWNGDIAIGEHLQRPEELPEYWIEAAQALDAEGDDTRVLELPGSDFASYRWGNTVDPITPFLLDRPYVARELIPYGSPASADLLNALDRRIQEGVFEPDSLAPVARLMGVGDVVVRSDLAFERFRTPRPRALWRQLQPELPAGLEAPRSFGAGVPNRPVEQFPLIDEIELGLPRDAEHPPAVAAFGVREPRPIVRTAPRAGGVILAGDGEGVIDAAAAGLLRGAGPLWYAAALDAEAGWDDALQEDTTLVLTDTNRRRARRWGTVRENVGLTEQPGATPLVVDPADARLDLFPEQDERAQTVAQQRGIASVRASHYGNPVSYTPEDRPANALDEEVTTAWRVGAFADVTGERLRIDLATPLTTDHVGLVQPLTGPRNRFITELVLRFDGGDDVERVVLDDTSRTFEGQDVRFDRRTFSSVEIEIRQTNVGLRARYDGLSGVGLAEVRLPGVAVDEVLRLPTNLLAAGRAEGRPVAIVMTRQRSNPSEPVRVDEETDLRRTFEVPGARREFAVRGTVRLSPTAPDEAIDEILGIPGSTAGGVTARSDSRLSGDLTARASAAIDGDPATRWSSPFDHQQAGHWLEFDVAAPLRVERLDLAVIADGRHSVPTRLRLEGDGGVKRTVELPPVTDVAPGEPAVAIPVTVEPFTTRRLRVTVDAVRTVTTTDYYSEGPIALPVAIAELGIAGLRSAAPASTIDACRDDLLRVDGTPVSIRLRGESSDALRRLGIGFEACAAQPRVALGGGAHELRSVPGRETSLDVDRVVLSTGPAAAASPAAGGERTVAVRDTSRTSFDVQVAPGDEPTWLILGQSHNLGWRATAGGRDLGEPVLIDGMANGWLLPPATRPTDVHLEWAPQRAVWAGLLVSAFAVLGCLAVIATSRRRRDELVAAAPSPLEPELARAGLRPVPMVVPLLVLLGASVAAGPAVGLAAALVVGVAVVVRPARSVLAFGPAAALAAAGAYTALQQARYDYPPDFAWPVNFELAHHLGWLAVALLAGTSATWQDRHRQRGTEETLKSPPGSQRNRNAAR